MNLFEVNYFVLPDCDFAHSEVWRLKLYIFESILLWLWWAILWTG